MGLNTLGLGFVFTSKDLVSKDLGGIARGFEQLDKAASKAGDRAKAGLKQLAIGAAFTKVGFETASAGFRLANSAGEFEQGIAAVKAVTKATREEVELLSGAAIDAGIATQFSPDQATEGLLSLATAGQTAADSTKTLIPVLDLAAGSLGQLGVAGSAEAVVGTLNSYQLSADQAGKVTDKLLRITQLTNFQTRDFAIGLSKSAAAGAVFGTSLDDVLILMGQLRNANIDASSASTAVREALRKIGSDERAQKTLKKLGVSAFDASGKARSVIDVLQDLVEATGGLTDKKRQGAVADILGARGLLAFNAVQQATFKTMKDGVPITLRGRAALGGLRREMSNAGGTAAQFRGELLNTFKGQRTLLEGTVQTLGIAVGRPFAEVLAPVISAATAALNLLTRAFLGLPVPVQKAIAVIVTLGGAITAAAGAFIALRGAVLLFGPALRAMTLALGPMLIPLLKIGIAIGVIVGAAALLKKAFDENIGGFGDEMRAIFADLRPAFTELKNAAVDAFSALIGAVRPLFPIFKAIAKIVVKALVVGIKLLAFTIKVAAKAIKAVAIVISAAFRVIEGGFGIVGGLAGLFARGMAAAASVARRAWGAVAEFLSPVIDFLVEKIEFLLGLIRDAIAETKNAVKFTADLVGGTALGSVRSFTESSIARPSIEGGGRDFGGGGASAARIRELSRPIGIPGRQQQAVPKQIKVVSNLMLDGEMVAKAQKEISLEDRARRSD